MFTIRAIRLSLLILLAASLSAAGAGAAVAADVAPLPTPQVPTDVAALFAGPAVKQVQASAESAAADASGLSATEKAALPDVPDLSGSITSGPIHQVFSFTDAFVSGVTTDVPVRAIDEWEAALVRDSAAVGTLRVWKQNGSPAQLAGYTGDASLGKSLLFDAGVILVEDDTIGAHYMLDGTTLTPLASSAAPEFNGPVTIADAQKVISARHVATVERSAALSSLSNGRDAPVGGAGMGKVASDPGVRFGWILCGVLLAFTGVVGILSVVRTGHRARSGPST